MFEPESSKARLMFDLLEDVGALAAACACVCEGGVARLSAMAHSMRQEPVGARCRGGCRLQRLHLMAWPWYALATLQSRWHVLQMAA